MPFPIESTFIDETERKLGVTFPSMFRGKMIKENGGTIVVDEDHWFLYPILDSSSTKRLSRTCNDIVRETTNMREWSNFPIGAVAIANNGTADQLVFLSKANLPHELDPIVYRWDHRTGNLEHVVDDFAELL